MITREIWSQTRGRTKFIISRGTSEFSSCFWGMLWCIWSLHIYEKYGLGSNFHISYSGEDVFPSGDYTPAWLHLWPDRNADFNIQGDSSFLYTSSTSYPGWCGILLYVTCSVEMCINHSSRDRAAPKEAILSVYKVINVWKSSVQERTRRRWGKMQRCDVAGDSRSYNEEHRGLSASVTLLQDLSSYGKKNETCVYNLFLKKRKKMYACMCVYVFDCLCPRTHTHTWSWSLFLHLVF